MFKYILSTLCALPMMVCAQTAVNEFNPGAVAGGVNYALPKTVLNVQAKASKIVYTPGEYAKYADRYLHISNVKREAETTWQLSDISVFLTGTPDSLKYFTVKLKDKSSAANINLSREGILLAVNTDGNEKKHDLPKQTSTKHKLDSRKYLTEDILSATSVQKMAELTAQEILEIRDSKNAIKRGQAESMPKDGASLKIVLDELNLQEEALMQLFTGCVDTVSCYECYSVVPSEDIKKEVLFRFSNKLGFVDSDDLSGAPVYVDIKNLHTVPMEENAKRKVTGLAYNMPSLATVSVYTAGQQLYNKDLPFAQFGNVDMLSPTLFNKGMATKVTFDQATGGIIKVEE